MAKKEEEQQGNHKRFIAQTARSRVRNRVNANSNINEEMSTATSQVHPNYPGDRTDGRTPDGGDEELGDRKAAVCRSPFRCTF